MAGITYLYGLWNINMLGDSTVAPSLMEAHLDIQACLSVLEALSGECRKLDDKSIHNADSCSGLDSVGTVGSILSMDVRDAQLGHPSTTFGRTGVQRVVELEQSGRREQWQQPQQRRFVLVVSVDARRTGTRDRDRGSSRRVRHAALVSIPRLPLAITQDGTSYRDLAAG
jgi:hypothetical protein